MARKLFEQSAVELKSLLDQGDVSSVEIVEALHRRADDVEPIVNAYAHQFRGAALKTAAKRDEERKSGKARGLLHGLPVSIKENIGTAGVASTLGMVARKNTMVDKDAVCVTVAKAEGAIVLGKTNIPQTMLTPWETENAIFGRTHNPWRAGHAPGGSSGGEGAAVASGSSVFGIGNDVGGSVRSPAALCGVCGIKPTADRWSNRGIYGAIPGQEFVRSQCGPLARTVDDLILFMNALDSPKQTPLDPRVPPLPLGDPEDIDVTTLRVGYYDDDGYLTPAVSVQRAIGEAVSVLEDAGVAVTPYHPPNVDAILDGYMRAMSADGMETVIRGLEGERFIQPLRTVGRLGRLPAPARKALARILGAMGEKRIERLLLTLGAKPIGVTWGLTHQRNALRGEEIDAWRRAEIDVVIAPALATPAPPHGMSHDFLLGFASLARYNYLDLPAGVVPVTRVRPSETTRHNPRDRVEKRAASIEAQSAGLPVGVQVIGRPWEEAKVLAVMRAIEVGARAAEGYPTTPVRP